ncbi:hypothetical protein BN903_133 [Halorubrum sp. AJ67]|nr:hypothetical protein BN903_133 [Halorubrum sp. AJ67]
MNDVDTQHYPADSREDALRWESYRYWDEPPEVSFCRDR